MLWFCGRGANFSLLCGRTIASICLASEEVSKTQVGKRGWRGGEGEVVYHDTFTSGIVDDVLTAFVW